MFGVPRLLLEITRALLIGADDGREFQSFEPHRMRLGAVLLHSLLASIAAKSLVKAVYRRAVDGSLQLTQRAQYGLVKQYTLNHIMDPYII